MAALSPPSNLYGTYIFCELLHLVAPYPPGHSRTLPSLPPENPWFLLPAALAPGPCPWPRRPNKSSCTCSKLHSVALEAARAVWAATPRDKDTVRKERNRKKKERKARSLARREAEAFGPEDEAVNADTPDEVYSDCDEWPEWYDEPFYRTELLPYTAREVAVAAVEMSSLVNARLSFVHEDVRPVWGLPLDIPTDTVASFMCDYTRVHELAGRIRQRVGTTAPLPEGLVWGSAFLYPTEHPKNPSVGLFPSLGTREMHVLLETPPALRGV